VLVPLSRFGIIKSKKPSLSNPKVKSSLHRRTNSFNSAVTYYFRLKSKIESKYAKTFNALNFEETEEIKLKLNTQSRGDQLHTNNENLIAIIHGIRSEYAIVTLLIEKQKLFENEMLLDELLRHKEHKTR